VRNVGYRFDPPKDRRTGGAGGPGDLDGTGGTDGTSTGDRADGAPRDRVPGLPSSADA